MKMTQENMGRFDVMVKDFAANNSLWYTINHDYNKHQSQVEFNKPLIITVPIVCIALWDGVKSLTEACTTMFTRVTREWNLDNAEVTVGLPEIKNVVFNNPATIILWDDGTKTVVKCQDGDIYSKETGMALCIAKKALGNKGNFNEVFKKWIPEETKTFKPLTKEELNSIYGRRIYDPVPFKNLMRDTITNIIENMKKEGKL